MMPETVTTQPCLRRRRLLPIPGEVLVQVGQTVQPDTAVARTELPGAEIVVNVAFRLTVDPPEVGRFLRKQVGDIVQPGDVLAADRGIFGLGGLQVLAPRGGVVESIAANGCLTIREPSVTVVCRAYLPGRVVELVGKEGVVVESQGQVLAGAFGVGGERCGQLITVCGQPEQVLTAEQLQPGMAGAILLGGAGVSAEALAKAASLGVAGIIAGSVSSAALAAYLGHPISVPVTGQEPVVTTLLLTEGFGRHPMHPWLHSTLKEHAGQTISINGTTHLRGQSVLRPEIVLPA